MPRRHVLVALTLILALAAFLRFYRLDEVPPGLYHDEAYNGMDALGVLEGRWPIYFEANNGRQPLFIYLQAPGVALLGNTPVALRVTSAVLGLLTVLSMFFLAREWWGRRPHREHFALVAALILAGLYWHVTFSRVGFRPIAFPLEVIWILFFTRRGLQGKGTINFLLGGLVMGGSFYTYTAAYLLPVVLVLLAPLLWWHDRDRARHQLLGLGLTLAVAAVAFLPLGAYFLQKPYMLLGRAVDVSILNPGEAPAGPGAALLESTLKNLGMFWVAGDNNWRHNIAGAPTLDPLTGLFFAVGLVLALRFCLQPRSALLLLTAVIMMLPGILTAEGSPHASRVYGTLPSVVLLAAWGLLWVWEHLHRPLAALKGQASAFSSGFTWGALALLGLGVAFPTFMRYFNAWAQSPQTYDAFGADIAEAAKWINQRTNDSVIAYVPWLPHAQVLTFLASGRTAELSVYGGSADLVLSPGQHTYVFPRSVGFASTFLAQAFGPGTAPIAGPLAPEGSPAFVAYAHAGAPSPDGSLRGQVAGVAQVRQAYLPQMLSPEQPLGLTLAWRQLRDLDPDLRLFLHIVDAQGRIWGQRHFGDRLETYGPTPARPPRPTELWSWFEVPLDPTTPPGTYQILLSLWNLRHQGDLTFTNDRGQPLGTRPSLGKVRVVRRSSPPPLPLPGVSPWIEHPLAAGITLLGYRLEDTDLRPGKRLPVHLYWQAEQAIGRDYHVVLRLKDAQGKVWWQRSQAPVEGTYPTTQWRAKEVVHEIIDLPANLEAPSGPMSLELALIEKGSNTPAGPWLGLGTLQVTPRHRRFTLALPLAFRLDTSFGDVAKLLGYNLLGSPDLRFRAGESLTLALYWQAQRGTTVPYKVSVQLLDAAGRMVAQHDAPPQGGQAPTTTWLTGEIVEDIHGLTLSADLPPGRYRLVLAFYEEQSLQRLPLASGADTLPLHEIAIVP